MHVYSLAQLTELFRRFPSEIVRIADKHSVDEVAAKDALGPWLQRLMECAGVNYDARGFTIGGLFGGHPIRVDYSPAMIASFGGESLDAAPTLDDAIRSEPTNPIHVPIESQTGTDHQLVLEEIADVLSGQPQCCLMDISDTLGMPATLQICHALAEQRHISLMYFNTTVFVSMNRSGWIRAYRGLLHRYHESVAFEPALDPLCFA